MLTASLHTLSPRKALGGALLLGLMHAATPALAAPQRPCHAMPQTLDCFVAYDTELLPVHRRQLDDIVDRLRQTNAHPGTYYPVDHVTVVGHSALFKASDPNEAMALARAQHAAAYLRQALDQRGLSRVRVEHHGVSTREPVTSNETRQGRNINRRVEVFLRSAELFADRLRRLERHAADGYAQHRTRTVTDITCTTGLQAKPLCAGALQANAGYRLVGALCMPFNVKCVLGKGEKP